MRGGKIHPLPENLKAVMTQAEWEGLSYSDRYHFKQKGTTVDRRYGTVPKRIKPVPEHLKGTYTQEEFNTLNVNKRFALRHPNNILEKTRKRKFTKRDNENLIYGLKRFGLSLEDYKALLDKQNGVCAICKQPESIQFVKEVRPEEFLKKTRRLSVDHDHKTGKVRGLLCFICNTRLKSESKEAIEWHKSAINYLELHG